MAMLHDEEEDCSHEDKRSNKVQRADTRWNLKRHIPVVSYLILAKFGGHELRCLVSSLSNVIRQADRQVR